MLIDRFAAMTGNVSRGQQERQAVVAGSGSGAVWHALSAAIHSSGLSSMEILDHPSIQVARS